MTMFDADPNDDFRSSVFNGTSPTYRKIVPMPDQLAVSRQYHISEGSLGMVPSWEKEEEGFFSSFLTRAEYSRIPNADGASAVGLLGRTPAMFSGEFHDLPEHLRDWNINKRVDPDFDAEAAYENLGTAFRAIYSKNGFTRDWFVNEAVNSDIFQKRQITANVQSRNEQLMSTYEEQSFGRIGETLLNVGSGVFNYVGQDPTILVPIGVAGLVAKTGSRTAVLATSAAEGAFYGGVGTEAMQDYAASYAVNESLDPDGMNWGGMAMGAGLGLALGGIFAATIPGKRTKDPITDDLLAHFGVDELRARGSSLTPDQVAKLDHEDLMVLAIREHVNPARNPDIAAGLGPVAGAISSRRVLKQLGIKAEDMYYWLLTEKPTAKEIHNVLSLASNGRRSADATALQKWRIRLAELNRERRWAAEDAVGPGGNAYSLNRKFIAERIRTFFGDDADEAGVLLDERVLKAADMTPEGVARFLDHAPSVAEVRLEITKIQDTARRNLSAAAKAEKENLSRVDRWIKAYDRAEAKMAEWLANKEFAKMAEDFRQASKALKAPVEQLRRVRNWVAEQERILDDLLDKIDSASGSTKTNARQLAMWQDQLDDLRRSMKRIPEAVKPFEAGVAAAQKAANKAKLKGRMAGMSDEDFNLKIEAPPAPPPRSAPSKTKTWRDLFRIKKDGKPRVEGTVDDPRTVIVYMSPDDFIRYSLDSPDDAVKIGRLNDLLDKGDKISNVPHLIVRKNDGKLVVSGHEGRHRATVAKSKGVEEIPVALRLPDDAKVGGRSIQQMVDDGDLPGSITPQRGGDDLPVPRGAESPPPKGGPALSKPTPEPVISPKTSLDKLRERRDILAKQLKSGVLSKKGAEKAQALLKQAEARIATLEKRMAVLPEGTRGSAQRVRELDEQRAEHLISRPGAEAPPVPRADGRLASEILSPIPGAGIITARDRFNNFVGRFRKLNRSVEEASARAEELHRLADELEGKGLMDDARAKRAHAKSLQAAAAKRATEIDKGFGGKVDPIDRSALGDKVRRELFTRPTSGRRTDGTPVTADDAALTAVERMEANLNAGVTTSDPYLISQLLMAIPGGSRVRSLARKMGLGGTGMPKLLYNKLSILNMLGRMVDGGGTISVDDLSSAVGRALPSAIESKRQALAFAEPFIRSVLKHNQRIKKQTGLMHAMRKHRMNGTKFGDEALDEILVEFNRMLDSFGDIMEKAGLIKPKSGSKYIPGGVNTEILVKDVDGWTQKLTQVLRRRWDPSKNSSINWKAAVHSKLATKTDDGSYSLNPEYWLPDVESGRGVNFNSLNEKGREIYLRNLDEALEVQSHSALKNSLGANSLEVTERGTHITYKSKAVDRTAPQGFDAEIIIADELAELFDADLATFAANYAENTGGMGIFRSNLKTAYGEDVEFEHLVKQVIASATSKNLADAKVIEDAGQLIIEKYLWTFNRASSANTDGASIPWATFLAQVATRTTRAALSPAWGIPVGTMELPAAVLQAGGSNPIELARSIGVVLKSIGNAKYRRDLMEGLGIVTNHMRQQFRMMHLHGAAATGNVRTGFAEKFAGHWADWYKIAKGDTARPFGQDYGRVGNATLGFIDALAASAQQMGGMELATELTVAVTAHANIRFLSRNMNKLQKLAQLVDDAAPRLSAATGNDQIKIWKQLVKEAGMGGDHRVAFQLNSAGLLNKETLISLREGIKHGDLDMRYLMSRAMDGDEASVAAHRGVGQFIGNRIQEASPSPTAMSTYTGPPTTANVLFNFFASFPRAWYARNINATSRTGVEYTAYLGMYYVGEVLHRTIRRMVYEGDSIEDVIQEYEDNPNKVVQMALGGVPSLGAGTMAVSGLVDTFASGGRTPNLLGSSVASSVTERTIRNMAGSLKNIRAGEPITGKQQSQLIRMSGVGGAWWIWAGLSGLDMNPNQSN